MKDNTKELTTPRDIAGRLLDEKGGNVVAAVDALVEAASTDQELYRQIITPPLFRAACYDILRRRLVEKPVDRPVAEVD